MRVMELKALARDRGLRNYSRMRKAELVALLQNNPPPGQSHAGAAPTPRSRPPFPNRPPPPPPQRHAEYVTLKFDDNGCCRIHSVSDDGNGWIVTDERYVVMPWKMVTRHGKNMGLLCSPSPCGAMTLAEAVDSIFSHQESEMKEHERRERERKRELKRSVKNIKGTYEERNGKIE